MKSAELKKHLLRLLPYLLIALSATHLGEAWRLSAAYDPDLDLRDAAGTVGTGEGNKALAALSYLSVLFALPYIFMPNDRFAKFHAKQGLKLFVFGIIADVLGAFVGLGWIVTLLRLYLIYKGMSNALNGKKEQLPIIGNILE